MQRILIALVAAVAVIGGLGYFIVMHTAAGQDFLLSRAVSMQAGGDEPPPDGLRVLVCGSAAPLPTQGREQGCLAVLAQPPLAAGHPRREVDRRDRGNVRRTANTERPTTVKTSCPSSTACSRR